MTTWSHSGSRPCIGSIDLEDLTRATSVSPGWVPTPARVEPSEAAALLDFPFAAAPVLQVRSVASVPPADALRPDLFVVHAVVVTWEAPP